MIGIMAMPRDTELSNLMETAARDLIENFKPLPPDFYKVVNDNFWYLVDPNEWELLEGDK